jgi:iron complex outermembrane recepter protein
LRMVPGAEVAQVNSNAWAIAIRGFNSTFSGKLLVLIDGRSVYNPDLSGVYWNMQDVLLEDVERIEVIRGPGGTLWGANAVNGVINIITKKAGDTQGAYLSAGGGSQKQLLDGARYGGRIGENLQYRVYAKHFEQGPGLDPNDLVDDAWRQGRFGFRADWQPDCHDIDSLTIQGDHYVGTTNNSVIPINPELPDRQTGENLLMRWRHACGSDSDWTLQTYYDHFLRSDVLQTEDVKTFDVDLQYRFVLTDRQKVTCGAEFRNVESYYPGGDMFIDYYPAPYWTTNYPSQFIQDEIALVEDRLIFTLGTKLEQNPYTGLEYQPSARLLWTPDHKHTAWGAVSRAVRTPMRAQQQASITLAPYFPDFYPRAEGSRDTGSEALMAYELGYREQTSERFSWDLALYYNVYDNLIGVVPGDPVPEGNHMVLPLRMISDNAAGQTYGLELSGNYSVTESWRIYAQYTLLQVYAPNRLPETLESGNDPHNQVYLRSAWDLRDNWQLDLMARYVDTLPDLAVPQYITMDARLAWRPKGHWELAMVVQNLLQPYHWEYAGNMPGSPTYATMVPRGVYGTATWRR